MTSFQVGQTYKHEKHGSLYKVIGFQEHFNGPYIQLVCLDNCSCEFEPYGRKIRKKNTVMCNACNTMSRIPFVCKLNSTKDCAHLRGNNEKNLYAKNLVC